MEGYGAAEQAAARKIFGKNMSAQDIANVSGAAAFSGATVEVGLRDGKLEVNIYHSKITEDSGDGGGMMRTLYRDKGGAKIRNDAFFLKESAQGQGLGAKSLASQVRAAQAAGVKEINTFALTDGRGAVGHKVWADLGYNGKLSSRVQRDWQAANPLESLRGIKPPKTIHELYARGGRSFWARRGESQQMVFSLSRGSKSVKILNEYTRRKGY
jgi:GNAT superfamily N-acetyltransferase